MVSLPSTARVPSTPGTYVLILQVPKSLQIAIGRLGTVWFESGLHAYVGSALGPGGLAARLRRHVTGSPKRHWHMDHLRPHASLRGALIAEGRSRKECIWAKQLAMMADGCIEGFGASDCSCSGHLFRVGALESRGGPLERICSALGVTYVDGCQLSALAVRDARRRGSKQLESASHEQPHALETNNAGNP